LSRDSLKNRFSDLVLSLREEDTAWANLKTFYLSCTNEKRIREQGYGPLVQFIRDTFGSYLDPHASAEGDLTQIINGERKRKYCRKDC
jgi:hypothetical protein